MKNIKKDFPIFAKQKDLVYLDSSATSLKPQVVIDKLTEYYTEYSANVHRGIYAISEKATAEYEETRADVAKFINANQPEEIIFTRGTTEGINLVASTLASETLDIADEIVTTIMEHHSNFVPWQYIAAKTGAVFKVIDINDQFELAVVESDGSVDLDGIITKKTKFLALTYVSNTLGTINPVKQIINAAKKLNPHIITIVDAAQAAPHMKLDVQDLGCDFLAFSSHKMLGPTGVGVLWGKYELLEQMSPYQFGGEMIDLVEVGRTSYKKPPHKFEAGTPHIAGVIGLSAAVNYIEKIGFDRIRAHEKSLTDYAQKALRDAFGTDITSYGPKNLENRAGIITFTLKGLHPHDIAQILDEDSVCIRAGHHCTQPLHKSLKVAATARASIYVYNTESDIDELVKGIEKAQKILVK